MSRVIAEPPERAGHWRRDIKIDHLSPGATESCKSGAGHSAGVTRVLSLPHFLRNPDSHG